MDMHTMLLVAAGALALWLVLTWYCADEEPMFGPANPNRVTFKHVLQGALRDVADVFAPACRFVGARAARLWLFFGPRITNLAAVTVVSLDAYVVQTPELKAAIMDSQWGLAALVALNLAASLSPRTAPERIPAAA